MTCLSNEHDQTTVQTLMIHHLSTKPQTTSGNMFAIMSALSNEQFKTDFAAKASSHKSSMIVRENQENQIDEQELEQRAKHIVVNTLARVENCIIEPVVSVPEPQIQGWWLMAHSQTNETGDMPRAWAKI